MSSQVPIRQSINQVLKTLYFDGFEEDSEYDLIITISDSDISFREYGTFLLIVDRFYGRLHSENFISYALSERSHLKISEIKKGSIVLLIQDILRLLQAEKALIFYLLIKFLPSSIKSGSEALLNVSKSYKNYEEGRLTRYIRKSLKEDLQEDEILKNLDEKSRGKLVKILSEKYLKEKKYLAAAAKFARKKLKDVELKKRKK